MSIHSWIVAFTLLGTAAHATDMDAVLGSPNGWQRYDWLSPSASSSVPTSGKLTSTAGDTASDPFAVVPNGSLWREKYDAAYTQPLPGQLTLSYEAGGNTLDAQSAPAQGVAADLSHQQKAGVQFQPISQLTVGSNFHDSVSDIGSPTALAETRGTGVTAESHLPLNSVLTLGVNSDTTTTPSALVPAATADNAYDAQLKQPLGKLPLTAMVKGHYEETSQNGTLLSRMPSLEQSLVWKPADSTSIQMGLRQQQYQSFPGVSNSLNEALFADWSQTLIPDVTWHSYAEVLNSRTMQDIAPAAPTTTGTNGTPQSDDPTNSPAVPTSLTDETVTFSTGPSFKVNRDVSASVEYSNRLDRNPLPGSAGPEQRVSVSLKGTF